jgi:uncharacterized membrane protein (UPF0182 family)
MSKNKKLLILSIVLFILYLLATKGLNFYSDYLWFKNLNYQSIFWITLGSKFGLGVLMGIVALLIMYLNGSMAYKSAPNRIEWNFNWQDARGIQTIRVRPKTISFLIFTASAILSILMALMATSQWENVLKFFYQHPFNISDPIFSKDISFYVFSYPFYNFLLTWLFFVIAVTAILTGFIYSKNNLLNFGAGGIKTSQQVKIHLSVLGAFLLIIFAGQERLKMFGLLYSSRGVVFGASYTDIHAQLMAYWATIVLALGCVLVIFTTIKGRKWKPVLVGLGVLVGVSFLLGSIYPTLIQTFVVEPTELRKESPYIGYNIRFTRQAYNLDKITEDDFLADEGLTMEGLKQNQATIDNVKLWDNRPLKSTYRELQEMRLYYQFVNVDVDRYRLDEKYLQVMLSARELLTSQLPATAQTWENVHLKYTHGYGLCLSPVNQVTSEGLPNFFIRDIPPTSYLNLKITRPEIYYGEKSYSYLIVNTSTNEFDYPKGDKNVFSEYAGQGGIPVSSLFRKIVFASRFSDMQILFSNYLKLKSRIMFYRNIVERTTTIAPFLKYDQNPYLAISEGKLYWIIDAYTTTNMYPYSKPYEGELNYIRNSVKVVVDAYNGTTNYYVVDAYDPLVQTYQTIFPQLFKPFVDMPKELQLHMRYPQDLFNVQASLYTTYHMQNVEVFYNKEDQWDIPRETYEGVEQAMIPYYLIMRLPKEEKEEFLLMVPFTPHNKNNMISWLAARCDQPFYGNLVVFKFSKDKLIFGPMQIEARINQDTDISRELTLWGQSGSEVIPGDLLVIPIKQSLLYIKPLYLQASSGQIPELKRIIVSFGKRIAMRETLDKALQAVFGEEPSKEEIAPETIRVSLAHLPLGELATKAQESYTKAQEYLKKGDWANYGAQIKELGNLLNQMAQEAKK